MNRTVGLASTLRSAVTKNFNAGGGAELTANIKRVLVQMEVENSTGDTTARPAVRYSSDGDGWGAATDIGSETRTDNGVISSTTWNDLPGTPGLYCQFGANVYNTANSGLEFCRITMRVDTRNF